MNILVCLDLSASMNKGRSIGLLNEAHEEILSSIARHNLLRSSVSIGFLIYKGNGFDYIPFGDASCCGIADTTEQEVVDNDTGRRISYCLKKYKVPFSGYYGCTNIYETVKEGLDKLKERLSSGNGLTYVSFLIVISDGKQSCEHEKGEDTINQLTRCLQNEDKISKAIVPLFIDVGTDEESQCLKELSKVFPAGYIKYKEKINFSSVFAQMFLSARRSANAQGGITFMLDMIAEKLKNG